MDKVHDNNHFYVCALCGKSENARKATSWEPTAWEPWHYDGDELKGPVCPDCMHLIVYNPEFGDYELIK